MSAYMVGKTHIDAMLTAGLVYGRRRQGSPVRWLDSGEPDPSCYQEGEPWGRLDWYREHMQELTVETAGRVGAMLMAENRASVNHRYSEDEWEQPYTFMMLAGSPHPADVLKACDGYEYQACEHPGWRTSEAAKFCDALRHAAIDAWDEYNDSRAWTIDDPAFFVKMEDRDREHAIAQAKADGAAYLRHFTD